jgi:outer membrane protein OmpA-like peptidoglycan-associated protein
MFAGSRAEKLWEVLLTEDRFSPGPVLFTVLACAILLPTACAAQENTRIDASGCAELTIFPKLAASTMVSCQHGDSVGVTMPLKPDVRGFARQKSVRGIYDYREYQMPQAGMQEQAFDNLMQLAPIAGFIVKYSVTPSTITARKEDTWILINVSDEFYNVSVVRVKEAPWTPPFKNAQEISREMDNDHQVAIYGVEFSPANDAINENETKALIEVLKYLNAKPEVAIMVESHKFSSTGKAEDDLEITSKRANAVVDWLAAHGIAAGRLRAKPFGRSKPLTENDTESEIQCNERIVFAKAAS